MQFSDRTVAEAFTSFPIFSLFLVLTVVKMRLVSTGFPASCVTSDAVLF